MVGPLFGTTVSGTLGYYQRHPAIAGSLEQCGLSGCRWYMDQGRVGWSVSVVVSIELRNRALFVELYRGHLLVVVVVGSVLWFG